RRSDPAKPKSFCLAKILRKPCFATRRAARQKIWNRIRTSMPAPNTAARPARCWPGARSCKRLTRSGAGKRKTAMSRRRIRLTINGREYAGEVEARKLLTDFLRDDLGLTGTH